MFTASTAAGDEWRELVIWEITLWFHRCLGTEFGEGVDTLPGRRCDCEVTTSAEGLHDGQKRSCPIF